MLALPKDEKAARVNVGSALMTVSVWLYLVLRSPRVPQSAVLLI